MHLCCFSLCVLLLNLLLLSFSRLLHPVRSCSNAFACCWSLPLHHLRSLCHGSEWKGEWLRVGETTPWHLEKTQQTSSKKSSKSWILFQVWVKWSGETVLSLEMMLLGLFLFLNVDTTTRGFVQSARCISLTKFSQRLRGRAAGSCVMFL